MEKNKTQISSATCLTKHPKPILTKDDIPYKCELVFNAGVAKFHGKYVMIFRDDYGTNQTTYENGKFFEGTSIGLAISDNGIDNWQVREVPICDYVLDTEDEMKRFYDPRLTIIEGKPYLCLAMDTEHGIRGCIASIDEKFEKIEIISASVPDNRNMVLFPEKIGGYYYRLERPFTIYSRDGLERFDIWCSKSPDLKFWGDSELVLGVEHVPFANEKIGPAAPPIKTEKGWLTTFHSVDYDKKRGKNGWEPTWRKRYMGGIMLLDLNDPSKVIGMSKQPLIAPELEHEISGGFRDHVIFPGGMILEANGEVKIYYGAGDAVECVATAQLEDLLKLCTESK